MATITTGTVINNPSTAALALSTGQQVTVEVAAHALSGSTFAALDLTGSGTQNYAVTVAGSVAGYGAATTGIVFAAGSGVHRIVVESTGHVFGRDAAIIGNNGNRIESLTNFGSISTDGTNRPAIDLFGAGGTVLDNRGTIASAVSSGVRFTSGSLDSNFINNVGIISAVASGKFAIEADTVFSSLETVENTGSIIGDTSLGAGSDSLTNSGTINGNVLMGIGIDVVDNREGLITGLVDLGDGADNYLGSERAFSNVDNVVGGSGNDTLSGGAGADNLSGGADHDVLTGGAGSDFLIGGTGFDTYIVESQGDTIIENEGDAFDMVRSVVSFTLAADDSIEFMSTTNDAGTAAINLTGNAFKQTITGNAGNNVLDAGDDTFNDGLIGLQGNDTFIVRSSNDAVVEVAGQGTLDTVRAAVSYTLGVPAHVEVLQTINATATTAINLTGNAMAQSVTGNAGVNVLNGGLANDRLTGGFGNDAFVFNTALNTATNNDAITDFSPSASGNNDTIRLENAIFTQLVGTGVLSASQFVVGTAARDLDDRIIYNRDTGALIYDSNGRAAGGAVQFATLQNKPTNVTNLDFFIT
ncbi:MAG: calcium-binding protein [Hyphomicrobium sp.]|nr:calcium-binding protein [Hyphomicrobium sp.]